jgi:endoglucanase
MRRSLLFAVLSLAAAARAQDLPVYVDALQGGFQNYSYDNGGAGSSNFSNAAPFHAGAPSIAFTGDQFNAISFAHPTQDFSTTAYPALRFFVHGGASGGQQLRVYVQRDGMILANAQLDSFIVGGPIAANAWRQVELPFGSPPLSFAGTFDRIDLQSDQNAQPTLYVDDVTLLGASSPIFRDGFDGSPGAGELRVSGAASSGPESAGPVTITVARVNGSAGAASVHYATADGSAQAPGDYASASGMLSWADGDAGAKTFTVTPADDALLEGPETIALALDTPTGATLGAPASATLTIEDDDLAPAVFRGTNVVGMEFFYGAFDAATGPVAGTHYPVLDERLIDYFAAKNVGAIRFLFSWEGMQSALMGPIPAANAGNYKTYFDHYKRIVDYATNIKGMRVIVEPWQSNAASGAGGAMWRGSLVGSAAVPVAAWSDFWTKMAAVFAGNPRVRFGLVNEPNNMSTLAWWGIAQAGIDAIRAGGATQRIYVPGTGYTAASSWTGSFYDTAAPQRSNAYGILNANGAGQPLADPLANFAVEVHTYLDAQQGGLGNDITAVTAARDQLAVVVGEARAHGYRVYLGEIGMYAPNPLAAAAWADFIAYFGANTDVLEGWSWWAGGDPVFWSDVEAPHFAISPTSAATYSGDTVNMDLIENDF